MKKISVFAGLMAAAAVSLTNCTVQDAPESAGRSFSIIADLGQTRTTNEGTSTLWAEDDAVNVFHAAPGSSNYVSDGKFTVSEGAKTNCATFTGETSADVASGASFDWYALYPYNEKLTTPASSSSEGGYTYIGRSNGLDQPAYDDMSKLTESHCPLYGKAEGVTGVPGIAFKHLSSVIEFKVVNNTGGVLVVKSLDLEASEDIVGSYYIDFTGDEPVYVPSGDNYVKSKATVNITTPAELAAGAAAKIYMPVKPYTQSASKSFKVTVSGTVDGVSGEAVVELNPVGAQAVFTAGKIKTVTVPVGPMAEVAGPTFVFNTEEAVTKWGLAIPAPGQGTSVNGMTFTSADGIGLTFDKASATTDCRIFSNTNSGAINLRVYTNSKMTFTAPSGYSVSRIEFAGGGVTGAATSNPEGYSRGVWEGKSSTVIITPGATMNIDTITVTLEAGEVAGPEEPEEPSDVKVVSVSEFIAAEVSNTQVYELSGTVRNIVNDKFGNFDLDDASGSVYVYGLSSGPQNYGDKTDQTFGSMGITEGAKIKIRGYRGVYDNTIEVMNAWLVDLIEKGEEPSEPEPETGTWTATAFASIPDGARFVLVSDKEGTLFAMGNDNGTSSAPKPVPVSVSGNNLSSAPASNIVWTMSKADGVVRFSASADKYLYTTATNNGLRVGTNTNNVLELDQESGYLTIFDGTQKRYIGVYNAQDWRGYTSIHANIQGQTFTFYVKQ